MLSDTLKMLRKQKGLTRTQASKEIGIIERNLKSYELNESKPPLDVLIELADFYEVSVDYLLGRDSKKFVEDVSKMSDNDLDKKLMQFFMDLPESSKQGIRDFMMSIANGLNVQDKTSTQNLGQEQSPQIEMRQKELMKERKLFELTRNENGEPVDQLIIEDRGKVACCETEPISQPVSPEAEDEAIELIRQIKEQEEKEAEELQKLVEEVREEQRRDGNPFMD